MATKVHALSDDQVGHELRKMTAFIQQEAKEKAREIEIKADEEFAMEKSKLVRQETDAIDAAYDKKFKQATMSQQITRSTVANKTRLRVLAARQALLDDLFEAARGRLAAVARDDKARYGSVLANLLLEAFYVMAEPELTVRARKADFATVEKALDAASAEYKKKTGAETKAKVDKESPLPEGSAGGVIVLGSNGKVDLDNTLETRLELLKDSALPAVRQALFGKNPNRKFYD